MARHAPPLRAERRADPPFPLLCPQVQSLLALRVFTLDDFVNQMEAGLEAIGAMLARLFRSCTDLPGLRPGAIHVGKIDETKANPTVAHRSCALVHLGEIAYRTDGRVDFDPEKEQFVDNAKADAMLTKNYRKPYLLPQIS